MSGTPVTDATFKSEVLDEKTKPVLVDFWAAWCGPCRIQGPIVDGLAKDYAGRVKILSLDVDASPTTAQGFGILSIPTLLIFKAGKVAWQGVGVQQKAVLAKQLDETLGA